MYNEVMFTLLSVIVQRMFSGRFEQNRVRVSSIRKEARKFCLVIHAVKPKDELLKKASGSIRALLLFAGLSQGTRGFSRMRPWHVQ